MVPSSGRAPTVVSGRRPWLADGHHRGYQAWRGCVPELRGRGWFCCMAPLPSFPSACVFSWLSFLFPVALLRVRNL